MVELSRESSVPLGDHMWERIGGLVRGGRLPTGTRLPSIRKLARLIGASAFTVVDAYDRLVARGLIESRAGRGFFVAQRRIVAPLVAVEATPESANDAVALASFCMAHSSDIVAAGSGV